MFVGKKDPWFFKQVTATRDPHRKGNKCSIGKAFSHRKIHMWAHYYYLSERKLSPFYCTCHWHARCRFRGLVTQTPGDLLRGERILNGIRPLYRKDCMLIVHKASSSVFIVAISNTPLVDFAPYERIHAATTEILVNESTGEYTSRLL